MTDLPPSPGPGRRTYLDHASTTPLRPEARAAVVAALDAVGDPGRIHAEGLAARVAVEAARDQVAALLGARNREVVFTSGASESIAAACWGAAARAAGGPDAAGGGTGGGALGADTVAGQRIAHPESGAPGHRASHQVVTAVEHSAVRLAAARHGPVTVVGVRTDGRVAADDVMAAVRPDTAMVHVQWGNHEVGTVQPVAEVVAACRERGVLVHVDAAQAAGRVPIDFRALGADLLSVSAHKLGGPAGVGALLVRRGLRLAPLLVGGDQERARRAGTENVAGIAGFGAACEALGAPGRLAAEAEAQARLTRRVIEGALALGGLALYGPADPALRLPHIACLGVEGIEPQAVLLGLDRAGVAAHSGSACSSESLEPSPVLEAMGVDAHHSLRVSVGWPTTDADVDHLLSTLPAVLADLRALVR